MAHGPQGTGNYKGKRDRHEKTPHNSAKKREELDTYRQQKEKIVLLHVFSHLYLVKRPPA